jgi:hypothetical protein
MFEESLERRNAPVGKRCSPILASLSIADDDLVPIKIHILDPESQAFTQTQTAAVHQGCAESNRFAQFRENRADLGWTQNDRDMTRSSRRRDAFNPRKRPLQYLIVEECEGGERLVLRRRGNSLVNREADKNR